MKHFTLGHDAELFLKRKNKPLPVYGLVGGTKDFPRPVPDGAVQEDNAMAELNIDPVSTKEDWLHKTASVMTGLTDIIIEKVPDIELEFSPVVDFTRKQLNFPGFDEIGCEPDYNAYTGEQNAPDSIKFAKGLRRFAGGHIHFGVAGLDTFDKQRSFVRACDLNIALHSVKYEVQCKNNRKEFYGQAGAFRPKPYGVEYRVPSNFWLRTVKLQGWIYDRSVAAINYYHKGIEDSKIDWDKVQRAINTANKTLASKLIKNYSVV